MGTRLELQTELETMLGSRNVYYRPPETLKIQYPAIIYSPAERDAMRADDEYYVGINGFKIIVIAKETEHAVIGKLLKRKYCTHQTSYVSNGLNHDVFVLYN